LLAIAGFTVAAALVFVAVTIAWAPARGNGSTAAAQTQGQTDAAHITVRGTGSINATPDQIKLNIGASFQESTVKAAQDKVTAAIDKIVAKLKAAGVDAKDYRTGQYNVEPVMDFSGSDKGGSPQTPRLAGFRVTNVLEVTLRDPSKASDLLDQLVEAGANTVYNISYTFADQDSLARQAYNGAVKDAETRATRLAALSNIKLGKIVSVTEASANVPGPIYGDYAGGGKGGAGAVYPGQQSIQVDVIVTYEAK
jgi:uncharacterized protein YggE